MRSLPMALLALALTSCGSGTAKWQDLFAKCASPRAGIDPGTGRPFPDQKGTLNDEKAFLRAWTDDLYLWYSEVPNVDPGASPKVTDYFDQLKTRGKTPSGSDKDRFHFWIPTVEWEALSQSGVEVGYGITWVVLTTNRPPRKYVAGFIEAGSPAATAGMLRGAQIISIDGADFVNGSDVNSLNTLNAGLFPASANEHHTFVVQDVGATTTRSITMTSAGVTSNPVPDAHVIQTTTGKVGYILFNDHIATAEQGLITAVNKLNTNGPVDDLILDLRYNGGGFLAMASQIAYMIAGPVATSGKVFETLTFNDKHPNVDPVTGRAIQPTPFYNTTIGFSDLTPGNPLPTLNLKRVFVLTGPGTCSASESILNGLAGVNVQVIQIGNTTCGKPYGFYPQDNCGTTYFSIQFKGVNAKGFGDYADGFVPALADGGFAGCKVADDFAHAVGDEQEGRLAAALNYRMSAVCPPPTIVPALVLGGGLSGDGPVLKSVWRQNRILLRK